MTRQRTKKRVLDNLAGLDPELRARTLSAASLDPIHYRALHAPLGGAGSAIEPGTVVMEDSNGHYGRPRRTRDTLAELRRRGTIDGPLERAGRDFQDDFHVAALESLRAASMIRMAAGPEELADRVIAARRQIGGAIEYMGGVASPLASVSWAILGEGITISDFATRAQICRGRSPRRDLATGYLIGALHVLVAYYRPIAKARIRKHVEKKD